MDTDTNTKQQRINKLLHRIASDTEELQYLFSTIAIDDERATTVQTPPQYRPAQGNSNNRSNSVKRKRHVKTARQLEHEKNIASAKKWAAEQEQLRARLAFSAHHHGA